MAAGRDPVREAAAAATGCRESTEAPQAVNYVPTAVPAGQGSQGLQTLELAGRAAILLLVPTNQSKHDGASAHTSVAFSIRGYSGSYKLP
jgi:hypothetical protein